MTPNFDRDKYRAYLWAHELTSGTYGDWVILDTETTGLGRQAQIVELTVISKYRSIMIDTLIKPTCSISPEATSIHGITNEMVQDAPTFPEIFERLCQVIADKRVIIYNAKFDCSRLKYQAHLSQLQFPNFPSFCAMLWYSQYCGDWHDYYQSYTLQKLPGGNHRAYGDALATHDLIYHMAQPLSCQVEFVPHQAVMFPPIQNPKSERLSPRMKKN